MGDVRLGFVGIVVEERGQAAQVNRILSQFGGMIRGRIGVPDTQTGLAVIGLIVEGTNDRLGAMTGKLGNLPGVTVKSAMTSRPDAKVPQTIDENGKERSKMKKLLAVLLSMMMLVSLSACALADDAVAVYALKGPTGIGMGKMMNDNDGTYAFTLAGAPDEVVAAVASGSADIAAVPTNLAATLYKKTDGNVQLLALNTLGVLSILENGDTIHTVEDLAGKTIYASGQGATPEYVLNYILDAYDLTDKVTVEYKAEHAELATLAASGEIAVALLPEPNVTSVLMQNPNFRIALDVTELFAAAAERKGERATLSMGCVIVRRDFAEKNPDQVKAFMDAYAASVAYVNENVADASQMVEAQGIMPKAAVAAKAIPNCHIVFIAEQEMKDAIQPFFQILFNANPKSVGGALPADDFYYLP